MQPDLPAARATRRNLALAPEGVRESGCSRSGAICVILSLPSASTS